MEAPVSRADEVRRLVMERYVKPARATGQRAVTIRAGDVQKALGWWNRVPSVCSALDGKEFPRMSHTRLVERRGPAQSTTAEWVFALSEDAESNPRTSESEPPTEAGARRLIAEWDGSVFRPCVSPGDLSPGQRVVLTVAAEQDARALAGRFGSFVGTLTREEATEMQEAIDDAFETISDEW